MPPILQFRDVRCASSQDGDADLDAVTFTLNAGDLLLLRVVARGGHRSIFDLAQGLLAPDAGVVTLLGEDWQSVTPDRAAAFRGQIGRVFENGGWISNLDVDENVTLAQRYHTGRPESEIADAAQHLARKLGLAELPVGRPHAVARDLLRRAQWVRALLGEPRLLLLDHPARDVGADGRGRLLATLRDARDRGAAVLWATSEPADWQLPELGATLIFELKDAMMLPVRGG
jgi:phospholipid/cholesterol/gamma-HCH transport system ATP-binding protein